MPKLGLLSVVVRCGLLFSAIGFLLNVGGGLENAYLFADVLLWAVYGTVIGGVVGFFYEVARR